MKNTNKDSFLLSFNYNFLYIKLLRYNEKDINIFVLKRILGHECLDATEIYTHISDKKLKYIMENCTISSILERNGGQR